jgi:hypothetical protein
VRGENADGSPENVSVGSEQQKRSDQLPKEMLIRALRASRTSISFSYVDLRLRADDQTQISSPFEDSFFNFFP